MAENKKMVIEIRSAFNDNVVTTFEHNDNSTNYITAGYKKICELFKINRVVAENRYYITKS